MRNGFIGLLTAIVLLMSSAAYADVLDIFSDSQGTNCLVSDNAPGTITIYIFHEVSPAGTTASQFRVATDAGFTGVYSSHQVASGFLELGSPPVDYAVAYGGCLTGRFLVSTVHYVGFGTSAACSHISLAAAPTSPVPGEIAVVGCVDPITAAQTLGPAVVNYENDCSAWCVTPVKTSTWGKVKALYR